MIEFLKSLFSKNKNKEEVELLKDEQTSLYDKLARVLDMAKQAQFVLDGSRHGSGKFDAHHDDIVEINRVMREVNKLLKMDVHVDETLFRMNAAKEVYLDAFILTNKGVYLSDPKSEIDELLRHVETYLGFMRGTDVEVYGKKEYNHRRLFTFTQSLYVLLYTLVTRYAK